MILGVLKVTLYFRLINYYLGRIALILNLEIGTQVFQNKLTP